jgi:hypothetical protein
MTAASLSMAAQAKDRDKERGKGRKSSDNCDSHHQEGHESSPPAASGSTIGKLPLRDFGLVNIPAVPYVLTLSEPLLTLVRLATRSLQIQPAKDALSNVYTIGDQSAPANQFLFNSSASGDLQRETAELENILSQGSDGLIQAILRQTHSFGDVPDADNAPLTTLSLDKPDQFSISWTNFENIYENAQPFLDTWSDTLVSLDTAEEQFWPTVANFGAAYNLIILQKVTDSRADALRTSIGKTWAAANMDAAQSEGRLYAIDLTIFGNLQSTVVDGFERFTPSTLTILEQDAATKALKPIAITVANGSGSRIYSRARTPGVWLYAIQAAKASITVYGIWLGHVYHWHIVTAAMVMTIANTFSSNHPIAQLTSPQSNYLIEFNEVLLLLWDFIAPPTSIASPFQFLQLCDRFAEGREYFDDDPLVALQNGGIDQAAFTKDSPWDLYPVVGHLVSIWNQTQTFVDVFVETTYASDAAVAGDNQLQSWISSASDPNNGNIAGLPAMNNKAALKAVLTSFLYRLTAHGISRLNNSANPALTFTANFPPCLQDSQLPLPHSQLDTPALLAFLPKTGTIGKMVNFYFTFVFSPPYVPFIPLAGVDSNLFFPNGLNDPRNVALVGRRNALISFIEDEYEPNAPQITQWPLNIET